MFEAMGLLDSLGLGRKADVPPKAEPRAATAAPRPGGATWAPRIDAEACRACGTCLDECPTGVFSLGRHDRRARVTHPEQCEVHCDRCATHCPEEGIAFPGRGATP
jgi:NAD-dependent dihydropyrimidine dehydrogenase PreA subunit